MSTDSMEIDEMDLDSPIRSNKHVSFDAVEHVHQVKVEYPIPENPRMIVGSHTNSDSHPILLSQDQLAEVIQKLTEIMSTYKELTYGDMLLLAIGKFMKDYPHHVEDFIEWLASRKWLDSQGNKINTFSLISDRTWLKPIIDELYSQP